MASKSASKSASSSSSTSSSTPILKISELSDYILSDTEDPDKLTENLKKITDVLETRIENSKYLENILPAEYIHYDPECIRKYSNFSFPKDYKLYYDFVDYYPSKDVIESKELSNSKVTTV